VRVLEFLRVFETYTAVHCCGLVSVHAVQQNIVGGYNGKQGVLAPGGSMMQFL
jgi:hypothetical protein